MQIKVRAVEGARVLDQRTVGGKRRYIGYQSSTVNDPERPKVVLGNVEPRQISTFIAAGENGENEYELPIVRPADLMFYRDRIVDGDLDYVSHTDAKGRVTYDRTLVAATKKNVAKRADAAVAEAAAAAAEADNGAAPDDDDEKPSGPETKPGNKSDEPAPSGDKPSTHKVATTDHSAA